eukprot:4133081-Heterocapsa_arctica.AAC.1
MTLSHVSWSGAATDAAACRPSGGGWLSAKFSVAMALHWFSTPAESAFCAARKSRVRRWAGCT